MSRHRRAILEQANMLFMWSFGAIWCPSAPSMVTPGVNVDDGIVENENGGKANDGLVKLQLSTWTQCYDYWSSEGKVTFIFRCQMNAQLSFSGEIVLPWSGGWYFLFFFLVRWWGNWSSASVKINGGIQVDSISLFLGLFQSALPKASRVFSSVRPCWLTCCLSCGGEKSPFPYQPNTLSSHFSLPTNQMMVNRTTEVQLPTRRRSLLIHFCLLWPSFQALFLFFLAPPPPFQDFVFHAC